MALNRNNRQKARSAFFGNNSGLETSKYSYDDIDRWRTRPLESEYPYVFMDGVWHKRSWGGSVENVSVLVAIGVNAEGHREVIGVTEGMREDAASWEQFIRCLWSNKRVQRHHQI